MSTTVVARIAARLALLAVGARACTLFHFDVNDNETIVGRTMEVGGTHLIPLWEVVAHPRHSVESAVVPRNELGFVSIDVSATERVIGLPSVSDGMNIAGLTVSIQTFRTAIYQERDANSAVAEVPFLAVGALLLGCCDTVAAAEAALRNVTVYGNAIPSGDRIHWAVVDATGGSVVFEYIAGALVVSQNSAGVNTNDPEYSWHLTNLDQHVGLSPAWPDASDWAVEAPAAFGGVAPLAVGHGLNLKALPGSYSPADRFVKMFVLKQHALLAAPPRTLDEGIAVATGLINTVVRRGPRLPRAPRRLPSFLPRITTTRRPPPAAPRLSPGSDGRSPRLSLHSFPLSPASRAVVSQHIVLGTVPSEDPSAPRSNLELTQWSAIKLPQRRELLFRSYDDMRWRRVQLSELALDDPAAQFSTLRVFAGGMDIKDETRAMARS